MLELLDTATLLLTASLAILAIGVIVLIMTSRRGFAELGPWNLANLSILASFTIALARDSLPPALSSALYWGFLLLGLALFIATASALSGRPGLRSPLAAAAGLSLVFAIGGAAFAARAILAVALREPFEALGFLLDFLLALSLEFALILRLMARLEGAITAKVFELGESKNDLQILNDVFAETAGSVDLEELIPRLFDLLRRRLGVDMAALYLGEREGGRLDLVAQRGLDGDAIAALMGPQQSMSLAWQSFSERRAAVRAIADYPEGPIKGALKRLGLAVMGGFPIAVRGVSLGALTIGFRDAAELDDLKVSLLETMTLQLGAVVRAASLHDELNRANTRLDALASTDPLTGLANRRTALRVFERESSRARRAPGGQMAVIMCDIDHFKRFNDEHGHDCGDYVLVNTAAILMKDLRATDLAARWGGEEFLLVLGTSSSAGALALAERIRAAVEAAAYEYSGKRLSVTITLGVALCAAGTAAEAAIALADEALYEGKRGGRNRVVARGSPAPAGGEDLEELLPMAD